jgi:hypothetical protein
MPAPAPVSVAPVTAESESGAEPASASSLVRVVVAAPVSLFNEARDGTTFGYVWIGDGREIITSRPSSGMINTGGATCSLLALLQCFYAVPCIVAFLAEHARARRAYDQLERDAPVVIELDSDDDVQQVAVAPCLGPAMCLLCGVDELQKSSAVAIAPITVLGLLSRFRFVPPLAGIELHRSGLHVGSFLTQQDAYEVLSPFLVAMTAADPRIFELALRRTVACTVCSTQMQTDSRDNSLLVHASVEYQHTTIRADGAEARSLCRRAVTTLPTAISNTVATWADIGPTGCFECQRRAAGKDFGPVQVCC